MAFCFLFRAIFWSDQILVSCDNECHLNGFGLYRCKISNLLAISLRHNLIRGNFRTKPDITEIYKSFI